jgi:hypothetical protein
LNVVVVVPASGSLVGHTTGQVLAPDFLHVIPAWVMVEDLPAVSKV